MPAFPTPEPITATISLVVGEARLVASDRGDTVVEVRPTDPSHQPDVEAAEQTRVEYSAGELVVRAPKQRGRGLFMRPGSVDVSIELPSGSSVEGSTSVGAFRGTGRLGACRVKISAGDIRFEDVAGVDARTSAGSIDIGRVAGDADVSTGTGSLRIGEVDGAAVVKNSNGDCWIGHASRNLRVHNANGVIVIDRGDSDITAKTARGDVRVGEVASGSMALTTAFGEIEIGIRPGTAAHLDAHTSFGQVRNSLIGSDGPDAAERTAAIHARTSFGDILIHRTPPTSPA
jgi:DUF4097 and DUF4098 domain-containing protein YvlB